MLEDGRGRRGGDERIEITEPRDQPFGVDATPNTAASRTSAIRGSLDVSRFAAVRRASASRAAPTPAGLAPSAPPRRRPASGPARLPARARSRRAAARTRRPAGNRHGPLWRVRAPPPPRRSGPSSQCPRRDGSHHFIPPGCQPPGPSSAIRRRRSDAAVRIAGRWWPRPSRMRGAAVAGIEPGEALEGRREPLPRHSAISAGRHARDGVQPRAYRRLDRRSGVRVLHRVAAQPWTLPSSIAVASALAADRATGVGGDDADGLVPNGGRCDPFRPTGVATATRAETSRRAASGAMPNRLPQRSASGSRSSSVIRAASSAQRTASARAWASGSHSNARPVGRERATRRRQHLHHLPPESRVQRGARR